jgi:hypothetical protein
VSQGRNSRSRALKVGYFLDETAFRGFSDFLSENSLRLVFSIRALDNTRLSLTSLDDVLSLPNTPLRQIVELSIHASGEDNNGELQAEIIFGSEIECSVSGEDYRSVLYIFDELEQRVEAMATPKWYSFLACKEGGQIVFTLPIILPFAIITMYFAFANLIDPGTLQASVEAFYSNFSQPRNEVNNLMMVAFFVVMFVYAFASAFVKKQFPCHEYLIGAGIKRHQRKETIRTVVLLGGVVSIVTGIFLAILFRII